MEAIIEQVDEGGGYLCNISFCPVCGCRIYSDERCQECGTEIDHEEDD